MQTDDLAQAMPQPAFNLWVLVPLMIFIGLTSILVADMYVPSLPVMAHEFGVPASLVQLTMSGYFFVLAIAQLIYGPLSDRFGRRLILAIGLGIAVIASLICMMSTSITGFIVGRILQALGAAASLNLVRSMARDLFQGKALAKFIANFSLVLTLAPVLAPLMGSYFQHFFGWRSTFLFLALYALAGSLTVYTCFPETNLFLNRHATKIKVLLNNYFTLLRHSQFFAYVWSSTAGLSGLIMYYTVSPFLLQTELHVSVVHYGWLSFSVVGSMMLARILNSVLIVKMKSDDLIWLGLGFMVLGSLSMLFFACLQILSVAVIIVPMMIFIFGAGFVFSNALYGAFKSFPKMAGAAAALFGAIQVAGTAVNSSLVSLFHTQHQLPLAVGLTLVSSLAMGLIYRQVRRPGQLETKIAGALEH